jgi:hypothetical protein
VEIVPQINAQELVEDVHHVNPDLRDKIAPYFVILEIAARTIVT